MHRAIHASLQLGSPALPTAAMQPSLHRLTVAAAWATACALAPAPWAIAVAAACGEGGCVEGGNLRYCTRRRCKIT